MVWDAGTPLIEPVAPFRILPGLQKPLSGHPKAKAARFPVRYAEKQFHLPDALALLEQNGGLFEDGGPQVTGDPISLPACPQTNFAGLLAD